ncbi:solute carrier family 12 member 4-like [Diaphorina citri]|uniref:Solute carrier family 12 member 4-like n=1 Tax=Diaphorina citri TaxID=121845 RepID=A0A1S3D8P7_DIACI|nr:solute carrier family 12 member 4-like [Diaphorina citri]
MPWTTFRIWPFGNFGDGPDDQPFVSDKDKMSGYETNLYLYSEEMEDRPRVSTLLNSLANYSNTITPAPADPDAKPQAGGARMGTLIGVYLPCVQNIFGVILFIRLTWVVGTAGALCGFFIVLTCCCVTMLTAISMSAIATNGVVPAGGSYFMIGRSLGPECGGAVGMLFYTGTTLAAAMYIIGAVEIVLVRIMAGSNRSGDLADAQRSIPTGTICAILTTSFVYLSCVLLFAGTVDNLLLRDKFGQSIGGRLVVANIAWPNEWVILIGSFLSTIGAGLQSLTGAPRLLQAIAKDGIIPFLAPFAVSSSKGEPTRALLLTILICQCGILLGNVDFLAPLLSMFFLMCYGFVNLACAVQTLLRTPNWRPRFKYYHWSLSLLGLTLCIAVMFMSSWYYALLAMGMAGVIYKYIEYRGAEKEWGDGIRGLALSAARYSLLRLEEGPPHTKNWRPQLLVLAKLTNDFVPKYRNLFKFVSQLKAENIWDSFMYSGQYIAKSKLPSEVDVLNKPTYNQILVDMTTSFTLLIGIFFPSVTGIMAGSNRSGDLADAQRSIPTGTICAILTTSFVYLSCVLLFAGTVDNLLLRDKFGQSIGGRLVVANIAWPNEWVILIGSFLSTIGAGLQSLTGAPRLLQVQAIVDQHHDTNKGVTKVRFEEPNQNPNESRGDVEKQTKLDVGDHTENDQTDAEKTVNEVMKDIVTNKTSILDEDTKSSLTPDEGNVRRMHTAVKLNEVIVNKSHEAQLVILNLPGPPKETNIERESNYMEFLEVLTEGLERVLMVRGGGREVITIYS